MTKIVETEIPDWARWMAQDKDGTWVVFSRKPEPSIYAWYFKGEMYIECGKGDVNPNWKEELYELK